MIKVLRVMPRRKTKNPYIPFTLKIPEEYLELADVIAGKLEQDDLFKCLMSDFNRTAVFRLALHLGLKQLSDHNISEMPDLKK